MCSVLYSQKPGGTRRQPVLCKGLSGDEWLDKTICTKCAVLYRARVLSAHCRANVGQQSHQLSLALLPPTAALVHTSHLLHISWFPD